MKEKDKTQEAVTSPRSWRPDNVDCVLVSIAAAAILGILGIQIYESRREPQLRSGAESAYNSLVENSRAEVYELPNGEYAVIDAENDCFTDAIVERKEFGSNRVYRHGDK